MLLTNASSYENVDQRYHERGLRAMVGLLHFLVWVDIWLAFNVVFALMVIRSAKRKIPPRAQARSKEAAQYHAYQEAGNTSKEQNQAKVQASLEAPVAWTDESWRGGAEEVPVVRSLALLAQSGVPIGSRKDRPRRFCCLRGGKS